MKMNKLSGKQISVLLMSIFIVIIAGVAIFFAIYAAKLPKFCGNTYYIQSSGGYLAFDPSTRSVVLTPNTKADGLITQWNFLCSNLNQSGVLLGWLSAGGYQIGNGFTGGVEAIDPTVGTLFMLVPTPGQPADSNSFIIGRIQKTVAVSGNTVSLSNSSATSFKFIVVD
jgi:hypothetical protein